MLFLNTEITINNLNYKTRLNGLKVIVNLIIEKFKFERSTFIHKFTQLGLIKKSKYYI